MAVLEATAAQRRARKVYDAATPRAKTPLRQVMDWVKLELAEGPVAIHDLNRKGLESGYSGDQIKLARKELNCKSFRREDGNWLTAMPDAAPAADVGKESFTDLSRTHEKCEDQFNVSVEERRRLGIRDDEQVCWIRNPSWWQNKAPGQTPDTWKRNNPGGRIITENGQYIPNGDDLILATRPMAEVEKLRERERRECEESERINQANEAGFKRPDDFDVSDGKRFEAVKQMNHQQFVQSGLVGPGSPSSGLGIEQYKQYRGLTEADIERESAGFALGHQYVVDLSDEQVMQLSNPVPERVGRASGQPRGNDGKFYSLPPTIRPRNLMQPATARTAE